MLAVWRTQPHGAGAIMNTVKTKYHLTAITAACGLILALCFGSGAVLAQNQDNLPGYPVGNGQDSAGQQSTVPSDSHVAQAAPSSPNNQTPTPAPQDNPPQNSAPSTPSVPETLTLPAGTVIQVRTNEWLSTDRNLPGDGFNATLAQPIVVDGWVVARRGQAVLGRVTMSQKAKSSNHNTSQLGLQLSELTFLDGQLLPIQTQLVQSATSPDHRQQVATVGTTTGVGAVVGAIAGGGTGAAIGTGVGAIAGLGIIATNGRPTVIAPETLLTFRLDAPVSLSTGKSQFAFHPVTSADYNGAVAANGAHRGLRGDGAYPAPYPPPPPPYWGYPYAYDPYSYPGWGFYPGPLVLGFGFGPGYYGRFGRFR